MTELIQFLTPYLAIVLVAIAGMRGIANAYERTAGRDQRWNHAENQLLELRQKHETIRKKQEWLEQQVNKGRSL